MPRLTTTTFLLACLFCTPLAWGQQALQLSAKGWDFGKREQTETDEKVITIKNRGARPVRIKKVELTCGCVKATLDQEVLAPGEETKLNLKLFANRGEGDIKKFAILHTNDPEAPTIRLPLTGYIRPIWTLDVKGRILEFGEIKNGVPATKRVTLRVRPEYKVDLVEVLSQPRGKQIQIKETPFKDEDGHYGWHLDVTLCGALPNGDFEGVVRVETDFEKFRFRGFRILARVVSSTSITPKVLRLGTLTAGQAWTGEIEVEKAAGSGLKLLSATSKDPRVKLENPAPGDGKKLKVKVQITPEANDTEVRGSILIVIDEPGYRNFEVKYRGRVQKKPSK